MKISTLIALVALCLPLAATANTPIPAPNWDRQQAQRAAADPRGDEAVREMFDLARSGSHGELNARLDDLVAGRSLSGPARDAVLFRFTTGLADFETVDPGLLERLKSVEPSVLVAHPESESVGVPLYDVAGAAKGVYQLALRRQARKRAEQMLANEPATLVTAFRGGDRADRLGFVDALDDAPELSLSVVLASALQGLSAAPELTAVAGRAALLLGDARALQQVTRDGGGAELPKILEAAGLTLAREDARALLAFAIAEAPRRNAALAIAQIFPALSGDAEANELLLEQLGSPELGSAAALTLSRAGSPESRSRLALLAQSGDSVEARRARTALSLGEDREGLKR